MEYNPVTLIFLLVWLLCGIRMLDKVNTSPAKWRKTNKDDGKHNTEWLILFFGPLFLLFAAGRNFWEVHLRGAFEKARRHVKYAGVTILDARGNPLYGDDCNNPAIDTLKDIFLEAANKRASDVFFDPAPDGSTALRFRIDGSLVQKAPLSSGLGENVVSAVKVAAGMNIAEKRRPQDGAFSAQISGRPVSFRVASAGAAGGEKLTVRLLGAESAPRTLDEIGFNGKQLQLLKRSISLSSGMILMCGGTGSGKTTTLYALVENIDFSLKNVISIEDPVERVIPNMSQMEVNTAAGITFASLLRNALRQNPDVICLGEIRDEETAQIAVHAAQTGHLILSTIHANDAVDTFDRLTGLGVPLRSLAATIRIIINQRMARRLCEKCRQPLAEIPEKWRRIFAENNIVPSGLFRAVGCPECNGTGYKGRIACFEMLTIDSELREELEQDDVSLSKIRQFAHAKGVSGSLLLHGAGLAAQGITSPDEIDRITLSLDGGEA